ncbi:MAG: polysaccharide deacetylase family protein, partial [Steroidobacteraceae bacterium]
ERLEVAEAIARRAHSELPADLMMRSSQVRQLADAGMEVGAHTVSHPILRVLSDSEASAEIAGSRQVLEQITGRPVRAFAYPNGRRDFDYTMRDRDLVAKLGFQLAVSTNGGVATPTSDVFELPRFTPWDRSPERWLGRLLYAFGMA